MRRTVMTSAGGQSLTVETDDAGTDVLDPSGAVLASHGTDRHDEMVAIHRQSGWRVAEDGDIRPPEAEGDPAPPAVAAGPAGEMESGPSS